MSTPAGWYPDPEREGAVRWWDGESWGPQQDAAADASQTASSTSGYDFSGGQSTTQDPTVDPSSQDLSGSQSATAPGDQPASYDPSGGTAGQQSTSGYDFSGGAADQQPTSGYDFSGGAAGQQPTSGYDFSGGAAGGGVDAPAPSWDQSGAQQYGQQASAPSYAAQASAPQYGGQQGQQQYGQPQQFGAQQYGQGAPKKRNMGLILGLSIGGGVVLIALIVVAIIVITSIFNQQQGGQQPDGQAPQSSVPLDVQLQVPQGGEATQEFTITEAGTYEIAANEVSGGGDPVLVVEGDNGFYGEDDDGGDTPLDSLLVAELEPGTYTATVTDWSDDDAYTAQLTVNAA